jgi:hypothetical protein
MKTLPLLAACLLLSPAVPADEYDDLKALLGGKEGKVVVRDQTDGNKLYIFDTAARSVTKLSEDIECRQPLLSPDGTRVAYGRGGKVYTRPLDGGAAAQIAEGYDGHWWVDDAGDEWLYYTTIGDNPEDTARKVWYPNNGKGIQTRRIRLKDNLDEFVFDWKCSAGPSRDGTHLGAAYSTMIIFEAASGTAHVVNGNNQGCNGSMSPDDNYHLMHLELPHTYFCYRDMDDNRVWYVENPTGTMEWQSPEFSTHPDFAIATAKEGSGRYSVWVVKISTKEMIKILDVTDGSNWAEPHLWVGEIGDEEYVWEPPDGGMGGDAPQDGTAQDADAGVAADDGGEPPGDSEGGGTGGGGCFCGSLPPAPGLLLWALVALLRRRK